ncbi:type I-E CRISPR-associated endonuclease Cas1e [Brevibacterium sp. HMSC063G07]|uniref:type I-E CRISPR-associated endonuclease Cas1e n=1 Tax=Brevibacterium sp. HMSC063G07 TaxID=1739261 RepID=UPI0008A1D59C|nr:type I-E CRISPR-associated endonuclease Cas1e [Brevibacterium sp. HMSC063G07]OFL66331.1 hypothetical protein HMPREF2757_02900 [Brevibacterium sp. HMSC063G07]
MSSQAPPRSQELGRTTDRLSFVYVERCVLHRDSNAVTATDSRGTIHIPAAMVSALLIGPGVRASHAAIALLGTCGVTVAWVGDGAVRCYATGRPMARSSRLLEAQARAFANQSERLRVARAMYEVRFPGEDVSGLTTQQLRGREGARVRRIYRSESERTGVSWSGRTYDPANFADADAINQALSAANACLYGVSTAVINALGMTPGLGFVHVGHDQSFTYDVADLVKAETSIPAAFDAVADNHEEPERAVRALLRERFFQQGTVEKLVETLRRLFLNPADASAEPEVAYLDELSVWAGRGERRLSSGLNHADHGSWSS